MAVKFNNSKIRLWKSNPKAAVTGIGINFGKATDKKEVTQIYKAVETVLTLKYGKGIN
jgi:hypothetical protein